MLEFMQDNMLQFEKKSARVGATEPAHLHKRALNWTKRVWRPSATAVAVSLALLLGWHVVNGKNGISVWEQKRVEDRQLRKQIDDLQQENARLADRIQRLNSDPDAIGQVARQDLHYAKPNEVIVTLPAQSQAQTAGAGK